MSAFTRTTLQAPDMNVRTAMLKASMGGQLSDREIRRLARRQRAEEQTVGSGGTIAGGVGITGPVERTTQASGRPGMRTPGQATDLAVQTARRDIDAMPADATREQRIARAQQTGTFNLLQQDFNARNTGVSVMDEMGNITPVQRTQVAQTARTPIPGMTPGAGMAPTTAGGAMAATSAITRAIPPLTQVDGSRVDPNFRAPASPSQSPTPAPAAPIAQVPTAVADTQTAVEQRLPAIEPAPVAQAAITPPIARAPATTPRTMPDRAEDVQQAAMRPEELRRRRLRELRSPVARAERSFSFGQLRTPRAPGPLQPANPLY